MDQFTETKVVHSRSVQYKRPKVRDKNQGVAAVGKFQWQVRKKYIQQLKLKDNTHFGTTKGSRGPLEVIFRQLDFKPLVLSIFAEMSPNVKDFVDMAVEYGVEHLLHGHDGVDAGRTMRWLSDADTVRNFRSRHGEATQT